jgi:glycosyltransferase involved in cell wall biosynthesis
MIDTVLFDCERLKYPNSGLYTFCRYLGRALLANAESNLKIEYYLPKSSVGIFGNSATYHVQKPWHKLFSPRSSSYAIWHSSNQVSRYFPTSDKVKIVLTIHDLNFLIEKHDKPSKINKYISDIQNKIDRASAIVCISNFVAKEVESNFDLKGKRAITIYNGCTIDENPENTNPNYVPDKPFIFTIGTVLPKKNFHVLPALLQRNDFELIIAGNHSSPEYIQKILEEAKNEGVLERVKIIGPISDRERHWYYKNSLAFVFPSIAEGFGLPVIEAMHYGKPVFLSPHTSLPEIGGDAAYYFQTFEPEEMREIFMQGIENFSKDNMEEKAKLRASQFSWQQTARSYIDLYCKLLQTG